MKTETYVKKIIESGDREKLQDLFIDVVWQLNTAELQEVINCLGDGQRNKLIDCCLKAS